VEVEAILGNKVLQAAKQIPFMRQKIVRQIRILSAASPGVVRIAGRCRRDFHPFAGNPNRQPEILGE